MAPQKPQSSAMAFLVAALKKNPNAAYGDIKANADAKKLKLYPIMFGRAQALLGIVKSAKRGTGKTARASAAKKSGRPVDSSSKSGQVRALLSTGMSAADIAKKVGCTVGLVYNVKSTSGGATKRPGRPRKNAAPGLDGIEGILAAVKNSEQQRTRMRAALERIQTVVGDVLA
ncbi:MAG: hypothetical protein ABIP94_21110 [Planctomycetota bacterium]